MATATGALSSATAHGYLPLYTGFAAASLAPSITNVAASPQTYDRVVKAYRSGSTASRAENRPPIFATSRLNAISTGDLIKKSNMTDRNSPIPDWNPEASGYGPIHGSDW